MSTSDRREREREARRRAILDAAETVMTERGFSATTMDDVAAAAELSKGTLYLYFENKDALCAAIAERQMQQSVPELSAAMAEQPTGITRLRCALDYLARLMRARPHLFRVMLSWMLAGVQSDPDMPALARYREMVGRAVTLITEAVQSGQQDGSVRHDVDPLHQAVQLWGGFLGVMLLELNRDDVSRRMPYAVDVDAMTPLYLDNMMRALEPDRAPQLGTPADDGSGCPSPSVRGHGRSER